MELTWVLIPFAENSFGREDKPRSSLYTQAFHSTDSKDPDIHVLDGKMLATNNTPSMHYPQRWTVTTSMARLKNNNNNNSKTATKAKILSKKGEPQRTSWEHTRKKKSSVPECNPKRTSSCGGDRLLASWLRRPPRQRKIPGSNPASAVGIFPGRVIPVTSKLALQWLPCQAPGFIWSVLGLVGPVSVYCDWARWKVWSATPISVWQHVNCLSGSVPEIH